MAWIFRGTGRRGGRLMAVMIPPTPANDNLAEVQIFRRMERELHDDWVVLHSLNLFQHKTKVVGEADFVVISTKGVFVLEVKGSRTITCQNGVWRFGTPGSQGFYEKNESPFVQAKSAMYALSSVFDVAPHFKDLLIGFGVVMPNCVLTEKGPEIEPEVLLDDRDTNKNLGMFIGRLERHWDRVYRERNGRSRRAPNRREIVELRKLLRPDLETTPAFGTILNGLEAQLLALSNQQIRALRGIEGNPRTLVTGRAGTGKTVVARDRALRLSRSGTRVLYVCFNQLLARHISTGLATSADARNVQVRHIHSLFQDVISKSGLQGRLDERARETGDLFGAAYPEVFAEAAIQQDLEPWDVLIVDEAQDLLTVENLDALDLLVKDGLQHGRWSLFADPLQNIYGSRTDEALRILGRAGYATFELTENCRNTREVATQTSIISGIDGAIEGAIAGEQCEAVIYSRSDDLIQKLEEHVTKLTRGGVEAKDIVILSSRRKENSSISGVERIGGLSVIDLGTSDPVANALHFATMHAFKGLERKVVLAIDIDQIGTEQVSLLHYAGLSRAQTLLKPFIAANEKAAYGAQAVKYGARMARS